ncbi:hypothetical protein Pan216_01780 [Planctomycetes bacterium Pan216]|uniref:Uncharacterized protein n=1 Tax=Kolteria novifilia TaxID=2527975 RepID=A0A518AXE2_9BACT|nr:hypothetical protein Pan216_01780 [Planctomycetes bacterium Pan216]
MTFCGLPIATADAAQDVTPLGPGVYTAADPMTSVMRLGLVVTGDASSMGNVAGPSGASYSMM